MSDGLSHITLIVQNLEKSSRMFQEILGAREIYDSGGKLFSISKEKFLMIGDLWIALMQGNSIEKSYNHLAFKVDKKDMPSLQKKIHELGLVVETGRSRRAEEGSSIYFYDYDNHFFELHAGSLEERLELYKNSLKMTS